MPNVTKVMRGIEHVFPAGTSVSLYRRVFRDGAWAPDLSSGAVATATVTSGNLSFANVPDDSGRGYVAVGGGKTVACGAGKLSWAASH